MTITISPSRRPADVTGYPFPFPHERYRYSANVEPAARGRDTDGGHWGEHVLTVDGQYEWMLAERSSILAVDPSRAQSLPHMHDATWDALLWLLGTLAYEQPETMTLEALDDGWLHWRNDRLGIDHRFRLGHDEDLGTTPLEFAARNVTEDILLLDQRDGQLWIDAGVVSFAADWSFGFDVGMSFRQIHGPVPRVHDEGIVDRAQQFIMRLQEGHPYRRTNWTLSIDARLDQATETSPIWRPGRDAVAGGELDEVGDRLFLRTEVQHLIRLPGSGAVMFLIGTHLLSFREVASVPEWGARLHDVLAELPADMAEYKGVTHTKEAGVAWLESQGVGA
ncbi:heme-dependent oxidative N-demethylase family protein [Pseudoclavibacter soli]|uniref:heme-dependent oxidative N-demethylase family protein n=1 Tax=Pseudoclavibacter soli TaxID=452623 RepID=UPI00041BD48A|nr:DUF3445 domain-containing protein [Pseudoclavibacter soli]